MHVQQSFSCEVASSLQYVFTVMVSRIAGEKSIHQFEAMRQCLRSTKMIILQKLTRDELQAYIDVTWDIVDLVNGADVYEDNSCSRPSLHCAISSASEALRNLSFGGEEII